MSWRRAVSCAIAEVAAWSAIIRPAATGCRILMYHSVGGTAMGDRQGLFSMTTERFEQHMRSLSEDSSLQIVPFDCWEPESHERRIAITFDDGYRDNLYHAAPVLMHYKIPFTVFVSTGLLNDDSRQFLSRVEVRELAALPGVTIGSHAVSHTALTECNPARIDNELKSSKHFLEDLLSRPVLTLAYPYGAVNRRIRDAAQDAGYRTAGSSFFGVNRAGADPMILLRTALIRADASRIFRQKLAGHWDWYRWHQEHLLY